MNSVRKILILSAREEFCDELTEAAGDFLDIQLELADEIPVALALLEEQSVDVVVVDTAMDVEMKAVMGELVAAIDTITPTPLLCFVGEHDGVEVEASLVFTEDAEPRDILGELSGVPTWGRVDEDMSLGSAESPRYFVPDSGFRNPSTSGIFGGLVRRLLYIGGRSDFRQGLIAQAESRGVELILEDRPQDVVWPKGAQALAVVAIEVTDNIGAVRRLVQYLRERHPRSTFQVVFITGEDVQLSTRVSEILGADQLVTHEATPSQLFDSVFEADESGANGRLLVVSSRNGLIRTVETVLGSEGLVVDVRRRFDGIQAHLDKVEPDIVLFDAGSRSLDATELASNLLAARPHFRSRLLGIGADPSGDDGKGLDDSSHPETDIWDLTIESPVSGDDLRRGVNMLLADLERGRQHVQFDPVTRVKRAGELAHSIGSEMRQAAESGENLLIIGLDLDDLSLLNVRYSWRLGDSVLRSLADMLSVAVGGRDSVFRHDDMFFVVRRGDEEACQTLRQKIEDVIELFQRQTFRSEDGRGTYATVSGGAVIVPPLDIPPETVLEKCWIVLKRACSSRRNSLLVAQLDPESFPEVASREESPRVEGE